MNKPHNPGDCHSAQAMDNLGRPVLPQQPPLSTPVSELSRLCSLVGMPQPDFTFLRTPQVTKKRAANKRNDECKGAQGCSSQAVALQPASAGLSESAQLTSQESSSSSKSPQVPPPAVSFQDRVASSGSGTSRGKSAPGSSRRKPRKLAVNFGVSKPSE
ncbi:5'-3' exoribonuclease 1-like [Dromiciops gliroides]|uniref:5'-3' exoribonuclease 1-like n=1 Tax=Dromiciops gliroides TaxID=33562 RepID=UPI001CC5D90A|nr:5'-3' exoribonuclease 1-like [Dromiciops gliroides]